MDFLTNLLAFIFALGVIIFVHEAGHLLMARAFDIRVLAFSLGFGKRIWGFQRGETEYRVGLIPLGGYVKLGGEYPEDGEPSGDPRDFINRPRWQRILVYLAGPVMNAVLAVLLIAVVLSIGIDLQNPRRLPATIGQVLPDSRATEAGLQSGDRILRIDGESISNWEQVQLAVVSAPERSLEVVFQRDGDRLTTTLTPETIPRQELGWAGFLGPGELRIMALLAGDPAEAAGLKAGDEVVSIDGRAVTRTEEFIDYVQRHAGEPVEIGVLRDGDRQTFTVVPEGEAGAGLIGVQIALTNFQKFPPHEALVESVYYNVDLVRQTFTVLGRIFTRQIKAKSALSGPLEIARISGDQARRGFLHLLQLMGVLSISIGLINLFPIPILDGGQILVLLVESAMRRDLPLVAKERLAQVGFFLVVALMVTVLFFDAQKTDLFHRLFSSGQ
jgi:regulator of sigma E protease